MYFDQINMDKVFADYAERMQTGGHLTAKAHYELPTDTLEDNYSEIDVSGVLKRVAENEAKKLYDIKAEDVVAGAHPEGSTKIVDAPDNLGVVETESDAQKKILDVAQSKVTLANKVVTLTNELDEAGFNILARQLDEALVDFLGKDLPAKKAQDEIVQDPSVTVQMDPAEQEADERLVNLSNALVQAFEGDQSPYNSGIMDALMKRIEGGTDIELHEFMRDIREKYWRYLSPNVANKLRPLHDEAGKIVELRAQIGQEPAGPQVGVSKPE